MGNSKRKLRDSKSGVHCSVNSIGKFRNVCGPRIKACRLAWPQPLSQAKLMEEMSQMGIKFSQGMICRIEKRQLSVSDIELMAFASFFGVSVSYLCGETDDVSPPPMSLGKSR